MAEPEPLKGKLIDMDLSIEDAYWESQGAGTSSKIKVATEGNVRSAVEWLKFKLNDVGIYEGQEWQRVADLLNEAFADVMDKKEGEPR